MFKFYRVNMVLLFSIILAVEIIAFVGQPMPYTKYTNVLPKTEWEMRVINSVNNKGRDFMDYDYQKIKTEVFEKVLFGTIIFAGIVIFAAPNKIKEDTPK